MIDRRIRRFLQTAHGVLATIVVWSGAPAHAQPSPPPWAVADDFRIELVGTGYRLPVNIAFVSNPDPGPDAPLYYVAELYGSIQVVKRDGTQSVFATGLLDYNPQGPIAGTGEQGFTGLCVERDVAYRLIRGAMEESSDQVLSVARVVRTKRD